MMRRKDGTIDMSVDTSEKPAQVPMPAAPQHEHQWLQRLVGEWTSETEMTMEPGKPPEKFTGTERVRPVGDLWVLGESEGQMPGGPGSSVVLLGFDPAKGHYVGTWAGSMMPNLWVYD